MGLTREQLLDRIELMIDLLRNSGNDLNSVGAMEFTFLVNQMFKVKGLSKTIKIQCTCNTNHYLKLIEVLKQYYKEERK